MVDTSPNISIIILNINGIITIIKRQNSQSESKNRTNYMLFKKKNTFNIKTHID